jgi:tRNA pseudouridine55 synthase
MYSAVRHQGQKLYELAREGIAVERHARTVKVFRLELLEHHLPELTLEIECSKGTYIRSIANDLGEALGCGAHLKTLVRSRVGIFKLEDAVTPEQLKEGEWHRYLLPMDIVLQDMPSLTVDAAGEATIKTGSLFKQGEDIVIPPNKAYCRAYTGEGRFLAILKREGEEGYWHPEKVLI